MKVRDFCVVLVGAALAASSNARAVPSYDAWFSGAVGTDWSDINNWEDQQVPTTDRTAVIGIYELYDDVTCEVLSGTTAECGGVEIGRAANSSLTIEAGASLHSTGWNWVGYTGGAGYTNTLNVHGTFSASNQLALQIGGSANSVVTVGAGGSISAEGGINFGTSYDMLDGFDYTVYHNGIVTIESSAAGGYYIQGMTAGSLYRLNGGTIEAHGLNPWTYYGYWHMGGTMEITADSTINATHPAIIAQGWMKGHTVPILKFTGTDIRLTMDANVNFLSPEDPNDTLPGQLDVGSLTVSGLGSWFTIIDATSITNGDQLSFVAGTDPNWELRITGGQVQVKYARLMGDCNRSGYVDDDDLSLLLANWHATTTWDYGNLSDNDTPPGVMGYVDDADLSLLLANWHAGTAPMDADAVPEPATIALLAVGGLGALIRKRR